MGPTTLCRVRESAWTRNRSRIAITAMAFGASAFASAPMEVRAPGLALRERARG